MAKSLSIVIPVHNEERNIVPVFEAVREVCATLPYAWHVLFVDRNNNGKRLSHRLKNLCLTGLVAGGSSLLFAFREIRDRSTYG
jgi:hypothetical protein